jgi:hypothetical protein
MLRKLSVIGALILAVITTNGQDSTAKSEKKSNFTFSGSVDAYFRADFDKTVSNNRTSFTNTTGKLALGMASVKVDYAIKKISLTADLGVGKRAKEFAYNDKGVLAAVKQLYASYSPADWIKFTAGTWATHVGYELVDPGGNRNYSMSYMFSWGPFLHTGAKTDLTFGKSTIMVGISNPTDYRDAPSNNKKALLFQYVYAFSDNVKIYLNYLGGQRPTDSAKVKQFDVVLTAKLSDKFNVAYNGTLNSSKTQQKLIYADASAWGGSAFYFNYDPVKNFGVTLRSEIFNDKNKLAALSSAPFGSSIFANTISGNVKLGPVTIVPELRFESANKAVFFNKDGNGKSNSSSLLVAAYYKF